MATDVAVSVFTRHDGRVWGKSHQLQPMQEAFLWARIKPAIIHPCRSRSRRGRSSFRCMGPGDTSASGVSSRSLVQDATMRVTILIQLTLLWHTG
jgi:hypothetical protein